MVLSKLGTGKKAKLRVCCMNVGIVTDYAVIVQCWHYALISAAAHDDDIPPWFGPNTYRAISIDHTAGSWYSSHCGWSGFPAGKKQTEKVVCIVICGLFVMLITLIYGWVFILMNPQDITVLYGCYLHH